MTGFVALVLFSLSAGGEASERPLQLRTDVGECAYANNQMTFTRGKIQGLGDFTEADVVSAKLIAIEYFSNYKVVTEKHSKDLYVLTQCGTTKPSQADLADVVSRHVNYTVKHFTIPLQAASTSSTVHLAFFKALGLEDRIKYLSTRGVDPCWQKALGCGAKLNASASPPQMSEVDAHFTDCTYSMPGDPITCGNVNDEAKGVHISASQDPAPLHSAEHIKFVAAFFNKEELATQLFSATLAAYASAAVVTPGSAKPVVAWISSSPGDSWGTPPSFTLSQVSYKLKMVADAGGANVDGSAVMAQMGSNMTMSEASTGKTYTTLLSSFNGSLDTASAAFFAALDGVDVIIDEVYSPTPRTYTFDTFMTAYGLANTSNLKFMVNKKVLRYDGTITDGNDLDWFESRVAHPEWAVEGLARQVHGNTSMPYKFFRNIADGEAPQVLVASTCTSTPAACLASAYPVAITMMNGTIVNGTIVNAGAAATVFTGSMTLQMADPAAFVANQTTAKASMAAGIAGSNEDITLEMVDVSSVAVARRLSAEARALVAGGVKVDYTVTFPKETSNPVFTAASVDTTKLIAAVQAKAAELGLNVTVASVAVAELVKTGGAATTATTATTGETTSDATTSLARCLTLLLSFVFAGVEV